MNSTGAQGNERAVAMFVALNNRGATCIMEGKFVDAIRLLSQAISQTRQYMVDRNHTSSCDSISPSLSIPPNRQPDNLTYKFVNRSAAMRTIMLDSAEENACPPCCCSTSNNNNKEGGDVRSSSTTTQQHLDNPEMDIVCRNPIQVVGSGMYSTSRILQKIPFIIIFNLALAYHLAAIEDVQIRKSPRHQSDYLMKSLRLYDVSHSIATEILHTDEDEERETTLLIIRILNNVAQIHKSMCNEMDARECNSRLVEAIMVLIDSGESDLVEHNLLDDVLSNIMGYVLGSPCLAAAA